MQAVSRIIFLLGASTVGLSSPDFKPGAPDCTAQFTSDFQQGADVSWKDVRDPGCLKQLGEKAFTSTFWPLHGLALAPPSVLSGEGKPSDFEPSKLNDDKLILHSKYSASQICDLIKMSM